MDAGHRDPIRGVHAGGPHPNQYVVAADLWSLDLSELEHPFRCTVAVLDNPLYRASVSTLNAVAGARI